MNRTFHKRFTVSAKCGMTVFALLMGYFFWVKVAIVAILLAIVIMGILERILHTTYVFKTVRPIDRDDELEYLIINEGRFSSNINVPICDILSVKPMKTFFNLDSYLLIEYGATRRLVGVQPDNERAFMEELEKRWKSTEE